MRCSAKVFVSRRTSMEDGALACPALTTAIVTSPRHQESPSSACGVRWRTLAKRRSHRFSTVIAGRASALAPSVFVPCSAWNRAFLSAMRCKAVAQRSVSSALVVARRDRTPHALLGETSSSQATPRTSMGDRRGRLSSIHLPSRRLLQLGGAFSPLRGSGGVLDGGPGFCRELRGGARSVGGEHLFQRAFGVVDAAEGDVEDRQSGVGLAVVRKGSELGAERGFGLSGTVHACERVAARGFQIDERRGALLAP